MNILYIDHYAGSEELGMEFRPFYMARELMKRGHQVLIVAGDYSHLRKINPVLNKDFELQDVEGVPFLFVKSGSYQGNGVARIRSMLRFVHKLRTHSQNVLSTMKPDVIICSSTYPMDTYIASTLSSQTGARIYHEIHDLWPLSPMELGGYSKYHPFIWFMQQAENKAYRQSRAIISILPNITDHVRSLGFSTPIVHVPNGLPTTYFDEVSEADDAIKHWVGAEHTMGHKVIAYAGGLSVSNAMMDFVKAFEHLKEHNITGCIIGDGIERAALKDYVQEHHLPIQFFDPIPKRTVIGTLRLFDALYIGSNKNRLYRYGVSMNKLFDYLMSGRPIVSALDTTFSPLNDWGKAVLAEAENVADIARAVREALSLDDMTRKQIAEDGPAFVQQNYRYDLLAERFEQALNL